MIENLSPAFRSLLLALAGVGSFLFFFLQGFPEEPIKQKIFSTIQQEIGANLTAKELRLHFPSSLELKGVSFSHPSFSIGKNALHFQSLGLSIPFWQVFNDYPSAEIEIHKKGGSVNGKLSFPSEGEKVGVLFSTSLTQFPIEEFAQLFSLTLSGHLSGKGELSLSAIPFGIKGGNITPLLSALKEGEGRFLLENGRLNHPSLSLIGFPALDFSRISVLSELKGKYLSLSSIEITGKDFIGKINGTITLHSPLEASSMNITVRLKPTAGADSRFTKALASLGLQKDPEGFSFVRFNNVTFLNLP